MEYITKHKKDIIIFFAFWILWGFISIAWTHFPYYDWFNYHYYNGYAFVENRYGTDFLASNYRTYFIPYLDIIQYYIINLFNNNLRGFLFFEAWDSALVFLLCYKIGNFLFQNNNQFREYATGWLVLYTLFAPVTLLLMEFSMTDMKIACLILTTFYILLKKLFEENNLKYIFISGLLCGCAAALKLTASLYCITIFLCILFLSKRIKCPFKTLVIYSLGVGLSFLALALPWYLFIYSHFKNPIFPYFNHIFQSPYANPTQLLDKDFYHIRARNFLEVVFFPFVRDMNHILGSDENAYDPRYAIGFISLIFIIPQIWKNIKDKFYLNTIQINHLIFLILFVFISFYLNSGIFGTYRYIISTFMLMGYLVIIALYTATTKFSFNKFIFFSLLLIAVIPFGVTGNKPHYYMGSYNQPIISVKDMGIEDDANVLIINNCTSFATVFQNKKAHYILSPLPYKIVQKKRNILPWYCADMIFNSANMNSDYLETKLRNIMMGNGKVYYIMMKIDLNLDKLLDEGLGYYSKNTRKTTNCRDMGIRIYGKNHNPLVICEYKKIK